jgi:hypothetical protein
MEADEISLEDFLKKHKCKNLKQIFEQAKKHNLIIRYKEIHEEQQYEHDYMLPEKVFADFALVRRIDHNANREGIMDFAIHPYGSSVYYTIHKRVVRKHIL